jgi:exodeoxyribonuclease VII small subunit
MPSPKKEKKEISIFNFEAHMDELSKLITSMESGGLSLEASLKEFERGIQLIQSCEKALKTAEQRVYEVSSSEKKITPTTEVEVKGEGES